MKALKEFGINTVKFDQHKDDNATEEEEAETVENLLQLTAVEEDIDTFGIASSHYEVEHTLSKHVRCASHTLSLVAKTDAKNALKKHKFAALFIQRWVSATLYGTNVVVQSQQKSSKAS